MSMVRLPEAAILHLLSLSSSLLFEFAEVQDLQGGIYLPRNLTATETLVESKSEVHSPAHARGFRFQH